jgi:glycine oxidase
MPAEGAPSETFQATPKIQRKARGAPMIAIVGGGICGLSIGWYLARSGKSVTIFDRGEAGRGATWAAAGLLAPGIEAEPGEESLLPLLLESRDLWPGFARELESASGLAVDLRGEGTLAVALDRDQAEKLAFAFDYQRSLGFDMEWLGGREARALEPHLSPKVTAAVLSPLDHQVDNRKTALALIRAFKSAGGVLREHSEVDEILSDGKTVRGIRAGGEEFAASTVVLAAGAWSRGIGGIPEQARPPVRPVKGQMLSLAMPVHAPLLTRAVAGEGAYLVPRLGGELLIGATVEEQSFDTALTAGGIYELLRRAREAVPGIHDLPIAEMWAGLRPASRDDAPLLGPCALEGLVIATGHHRNGILLAPVTARVIADFILTGHMRDDIQIFAPSRFAA